MTDPLILLKDTHGYDPGEIRKVNCGSKYLAVLLKNGNIGVCSTLNKVYYIDNSDIVSPGLVKVKHRILLNAYYCAKLNYLRKYNAEYDIFDKIKFNKYSFIVMTGYFGPLIKKFQKENIELHVFDKQIEHNTIVSMAKQAEYLSKADVLVLSATTIFNNSFCEQLENTNKDCDIYLLGPSSIMSEKILAYPGIKSIFGSVFNNNDLRVLEQIKLGGGTKSFSAFSKKVFLGDD